MAVSEKAFSQAYIDASRNVARELAVDIQDAARHAHNEEELRIKVEKLLEPRIRELEIESVPRYERSYAAKGSVLRGRSDAVYGRLVIEYEGPGTFSTKRGIEHACEQLEQYLLAEAGGELTPESVHRLVGVGLDGERIFFLRYRWGVRSPGTTRQLSSQPSLPLASDSTSETGPVAIVSEVYPVGETTIHDFLLLLRALRRRRLTPEALADDFGPSGERARVMVCTLYESLLTHAKQPRVETLYGEWDRLFGIVYGQDRHRAADDATVLARTYGISREVQLTPLLFAVHTYFALLMKLLAAELTSLQNGSLVSSVAADLPLLSDDTLRARLEDLENGGLFARMGVRNFLEGDFFGWYLDVWKPALADSIRDLARTLANFEPGTATLEPESTRDLLKKLYQYLIPRELRHDLGEYYTPDWLAEMVLDQVGYDGAPDGRLLDPACGSGTFLVLAIRRARQYAEEHFLEPREAVRAILNGIVGFDLNPLAVIAARTNYLLALGTLFRHVAPLEIPVYLCDSVLSPAEQRGLQGTLETLTDYSIPSTVETFHVPKYIVERGELPKLTELLEQCVVSDYSPEEFMERARRELTRADDDATIRDLYTKILRLERAGRNGIWARLIKNAFAPIFAGTFDFVVGNPPWVNWESLADDYRDATTKLWGDYGLFTLSGHAANLGGGKKDLSMLMLYVAADSYLKGDGRLAFLITQTIFKTQGAGDGFRRFRLGGGAPLHVRQVEDMSSLQPFEGANNRTATILIEKGSPTKYPVPYTVWRKLRPGRLAADLTPAVVRERTSTVTLAAQPIRRDQPTSPWITAPTQTLAALQRAIAPSPYRAYAGACTWLNGVYWVEIVSRRPDGLLVIKNRPDTGKISLPSVEAVVEPDLVYPLLRGRDVARWHAAPSLFMLMSQDPETRTGYEESRMKVELPHTYAYLNAFRMQLERRSGYRKYFDAGRDAFYSIYNVSRHTMAPHKVVWREQASTFTACAVTGDQPPIPDHKLMLVPCASKDEAYYLSACLNSAVARLIVGSYVVSTSTCTHVLEHVAVPKFDPAVTAHACLAKWGGAAHHVAASGERGEQLARIESEIDQLAAALWGIEGDGLAAIQEVLNPQSDL